MTAITNDQAPSGPAPASRVKLDQPLDIRAVLIFLAVIAGALFFMAYSIYSDISEAGGGPTTILPFLLLGVAMLIALGFEFVNGFHDTANAVATVIYTHALQPQFAVVWSGCLNLLGVLTSTGAVAFGIVSLLPVELILQVGSSAGYAMVFALLIAAIIWNLGTWWLGLPASVLAHADRLDRRRRRRQCAAARPGRHVRRRLEQGHRDRLRAAAVADLRLRARGPAPACREGR